MSRTTSRPRIVIVGAGFAGYHAARVLGRRATRTADVTLVNSTDFFLYLPLLPEASAGILDPRGVAIPLSATLPGVQCVLGEVHSVDLAARRLCARSPEDRDFTLEYDRLVLSVGSVNKLLPVPGLNRYAHGFRGIPEALYLRDHVIRQIELADQTDDPDERTARCTFVVVGAGYTGTEVAAQGQLLTSSLARHRPRLRGQPIRWLLLDLAERTLPELDPRLSRTAERVLGKRGVEVRTRTTVEEATSDGVRLNSGEHVPTRTLIWCVGVRPDPLVESMGLPTIRGRVTVDDHLAVPGHPGVFACGDVAAVPDLTRPGQLTAMTAQHAQRQGKLAGHNVLASITGAATRAYKHRDLGFLVDLGGAKAAANPLGIALSGLVAKAVTRAYHLYTLPANRLHVAADWAVDAVTARQSVQLGLVRAGSVPLDSTAPEIPRTYPLPSRPIGPG